MAEVAVRGALALIAGAGGGLVESYPHDLPPDRKISASFLYNATRRMYERLGFTYQRPKGKGNCVMTRWSLPPATQQRVRSDQAWCCTMFSTLPSGARTKNRRTPQDSVPSGCTIS